jgi:hypothetical protein
LGGVCFTHSHLAHASSAYLTDTRRGLFIAADAVPPGPIAVLNIHARMMVRGSGPSRIHSIPFEMESLKVPKGASFFDQQKI